MSDFTYIRATLAGPIPDLIVATWQELCADHKATGAYSDNLTFARLFPYRGNPLSCAVANTDPKADMLENGREGFHLPSRIDWGAVLARQRAKHPDWNITKPWVTVPFTHGTPVSESGGSSSTRQRTAMPRSVYEDAKRAITGDKDARARVDAAGKWLSRPYATMSLAKGQGNRAVAELSALTIRARSTLGQPGYTWKSRMFEGLTHRAQKSPAGKTTGGSWVTFRTITPDSLGWWIPQMEGFHWAARTADAVRGDVRDLIAAAAVQDLGPEIARAIRVAVGGAQ